MVNDLYYVTDTIQRAGDTDFYIKEVKEEETYYMYRNSESVHMNSNHFKYDLAFLSIPFSSVNCLQIITDAYVKGYSDGMHNGKIAENKRIIEQFEKIAKI